MGEQMHSKHIEIDMVSEFSLKELEAISMECIEGKYAIEDAMLQAISEGNVEKALEKQAELTEFPNTRYRKPTRETMIGAVITLNTLCRKAAQKASVHPAHIDHVSAGFSKRILSASSVELMKGFDKEIIRKYCLLVRTYSLKGYSKLTQDALNYIDFNLTETLSLAFLADKLNVTKKHLSAHFKNEMGRTITDYINRKRINDSLKYLQATDLPISDVAIRVGVYDLNYYSRVFRKIMDMTPSQYRNLI